MKRLKRLRVAFLLILVTVFIAGCGIRQGVSWPDVAVYESSDGQPSIIVAYKDYIERVDLTGQNVFLLNEDGSVRIDPDDGAKRKWAIYASDLQGTEELNLEGDVGLYLAPIRIGEETLMVTDYNGRLLIFSATDRSVSMKVGSSGQVDLPGHVVASPVVHTLDDEEGRLVLVPLRENDVVAYNIDDDFAEAWTFPTERGVWASPLVVDDVVYIPGMDHKLYAVDANTGMELWRVDTGGAVAGTPFYDGEDLYIGTLGRQFLRIGIGEGYSDDQERILATYDTEGWIWSTPAYDDGTFYFGDMNGFIYAVRPAQSGNGFEEVWRHATGNGGIRPSPIVTEDHVIVASRKGNLYWLSRANGSEFLTHEIDAEILSELVVLEGSDDGERPTLVFVTTDKNDKTLIPYTLDGARYAWTYTR